MIKKAMMACKFWEKKSQEENFNVGHLGTPPPHPIWT